MQVMRSQWNEELGSQGLRGAAESAPYLSNGENGRLGASGRIVARAVAARHLVPELLHDNTRDQRENR